MIKERMMERMRLVVMVIVGLLLGQRVTAQTDHVFKMVKENGHFFIETTVNGVEAKLMFESGVPGLMMGDAFYEAHKEALQMEVKACDEKIRYLNGLYNVTASAEARLRIGDAYFEGPVKIVEGQSDLKMPIHMLHHSADSSSIVRMDLGNSEFRVISRERMQDLTKDASAFDISFNKWGMPVVNTRLSMDVGGRQVTIKGNFIADMGNASLLFLNKSREAVQAALKESGVTLQAARDKNGKVVAEGLYADRLTICGKTNSGVSVGVHSFKSLDEYGFLGLKFFTMPTVFDFSNQKMYLCN